MISVVVPVYNSEKYIGRCLGSLAKQSWTDFEALVVDNNSKDGSKAVIERYAAEDQRFKYLHCNKQGVGSARNMGLEAAAGSHVFFLDSDDELVEGTLSELVASALICNADIVICNALNMGSRSTQRFDRSRPRDKLAVGSADISKLVHSLLPTYLLHNVFKLYNLDFLRKHEMTFYPMVHNGEDLLFNLRVYDNAHCMVYLSQPLYLYNFTSGGLVDRYHTNLLDIKLLLLERTRAYLTRYALFDDSYYIIVLNEIFALLRNALMGGDKDEFKKILKLDYVSELVKSKVFRRLPLAKKAMFICIKLHLTFIIRLAVKFMSGRLR